MFFTLINPSFQIIIQYIKSDTPIHFLHGVGQGTIVAVYLWMLSYNVVLSFCNNKHEGARFRNKDGNIIATALAPTCVDDSVILINEENLRLLSINVVTTHANDINFNGGDYN